MLKLILRQFYKHRRGLFFILLVWVAGGYAIFSYRHIILENLVRLFTSFPPPGEQKAGKAYSYVERSRQILTQGSQSGLCRLYESAECRESQVLHTVRLDLMARACKIYPIRYKGNASLFRPDWLARRRDWNLNPQSPAELPAATPSANLVEPDEYWAANRKIVLESLKQLLDALNYAFEIPPDVRGEKSGSTWILPEFVDAHARALCQEIIGLYTWRDYIEFQELRAVRALKMNIRDYDRLYIFPDEQELAVLHYLRKDPRYRLALKRYGAGSPPEAGNPQGCKSGPLRLACISPTEAFQIYNKLLHILPAAEHGGYRFKLGLLYMMKARTRPGRNWERAFDNLSAAARDSGLRRRAYMNMARIHIIKHNFRQARILLRRVRRLGPEDKELRDLIRITLMGLGRFEDADCFSDLHGGVYGIRERCRRFRL